MFSTDLNRILGPQEPVERGNAKQAFLAHLRDRTQNWALANPREDERPDYTGLSRMDWIAEVIKWMRPGLWSDALQIFEPPGEKAPSPTEPSGPHPGYRYGSQNTFERGMQAAIRTVRKAVDEQPEMSRKDLYRLCAFLRACVGTTQGSDGLPGFFRMFDMNQFVVPQMRTPVAQHYLAALPELQKFLEPICFSAFAPRPFEHPARHLLPSGASIGLDPLADFGRAELWHPNLDPRGWDAPLSFQGDRLSKEAHAALVGEFARQTWVQRGGGAVAEMAASALAPEESHYPPVAHHPSLWLMANLLAPDAFSKGFVACDQQADWRGLVDQLGAVDRAITAWLRDAGVSSAPAPQWGSLDARALPHPFEQVDFELARTASTSSLDHSGFLQEGEPAPATPVHEPSAQYVKLLLKAKESNAKMSGPSTHPQPGP